MLNIYVKNNRHFFAMMKIRHLISDEGHLTQLGFGHWFKTLPYDSHDFPTQSCEMCVSEQLNSVGQLLKKTDGFNAFRILREVRN